MPARRTQRAAGRYIVNLTVEQLDGAKRRVYFYGRTQSEAKRKAQPPGSAFEQGAPLRDATLRQRLAVRVEGNVLQASDRAPSTKHLNAGLTLRHVEPVIGRTPSGRCAPLTSPACSSAWKTAAPRR